MNKIELHTTTPQQTSDVLQLEFWVTKRDLGRYWGCGLRFIEKCTAEGMPHRKIGSSNRYRISECDAWMYARQEAAAA